MWEKYGNVILRPPYSSKFGEMFSFYSPFRPFVTFWINGRGWARVWASPSETHQSAPPPPPPPPPTPHPPPHPPPPHHPTPPPTPPPHTTPPPHPPHPHTPHHTHTPTPHHTPTTPPTPPHPGQTRRQTNWDFKICLLWRSEWELCYKW